MRGLLQGVRSAYSTRAVWHKSQYMGFIIANFLLSLVMFWFVDRKLSRTTTFTMKMADRIEHSRNAQLARVSFYYQKQQKFTYFTSSFLVLISCCGVQLVSLLIWIVIQVGILILIAALPAESSTYISFLLAAYNMLTIAIAWVVHPIVGIHKHVALLNKTRKVLGLMVMLYTLFLMNKNVFSRLLTSVTRRHN